MKYNPRVIIFFARAFAVSIAAFFGAGSCHGQPCVAPPAGIVGWWRGEGNASDSVGTNNGTLVSGTSFGPGEVGQSFVFNGVSQYVNIPNAPALNPTNAMTIEAWIFLNAFSGNNAVDFIVKDDPTGSDRQFLFGMVNLGGNWYLRPSVGVPGGLAVFNGSVALHTNTWYHVAMTYDGSSLRQFINGVQDGNLVVGGPILPTSNPLIIGGEASGPWDFAGKVDDFALYNRALTPQEIQAIYAAGGSGKCAGPVAPVIVIQPAGQAIYVGQNATLSVVAGGSPALGYQWALGGANVPGATSSAFSIIGAQLTDSGNYSVTVSNAVGVVVSSNAAVSVNPVSCDPVPSGIVGWWRGEGNANDSIGTNNGALKNGVTFGSGEVGQGFVFNGINQYVSIPNAPALNPASLTIEAWIFLNNFSANDGVDFIVKDDPTGSDRQFLFGMVNIGGNWYLRPAVGVASGLAVFNGSLPLHTNTWYHVAMTYDGTTLAQYINGAQDGSMAVGGPVVSSANPLIFGGEASGPWDFAGKIDEVSLYNRALTPVEVQSIYNSGSAGKCAVAPSIVTQPASQTLLAGSTAQFTVAAAGASPLNYQWLFGGANIVGATTTSLTISNVQSANSGNYSVIVSNIYGTATSSNALLTVHTPPYITGVHSISTVVQGTSATFTVTAGGDLPLSYQWLLGGTNIPGATASAYTIVSAQPSDAGPYSVVVSNAFGTATASASTLTVLSPPSIVTQPANLTVITSSNATFTVVAAGTPTLVYQWLFNGMNISGATASALTLLNVQPANAGIYSVIVTNDFGSILSSNATLTVNSRPCDPPPSGLVSWWPLNGNWNDVVSGNNGIPVTSNFVSGEVGQAMSFNGTSSSVRIPAAPNLNLGIGGGLSIECWINPADVSSEQPLVEWNSNTGVFNGIGAHFWIAVPSGGGGSGSIWANLLDSSLTPHSLSTTTGLVKTNVFQHVAVTYSKSSGLMVIYLNGVMVAQTNLGSSFVANTTSDVYLGLRPPGGAGPVYFDGIMDEVSIYDRALSASEIQGIYNAGSAGKCAPQVAPTIIVQPAGQTVPAGGTASFSVVAAGSIPLSYQWFDGTASLAGATSSSLTISNAQMANAGSYSVVVSNAYGTATSSNALLTVTPPPCVPSPAGLVGWWKGEGNAYDSIGGNHGTLVDGATFGAGKVGQAFALNGINQYVNVPNAPALNPSNAITLEAWINWASFGGSGAVDFIVKDDPYGADRQYMFGMVQLGANWYLRPAVGVPSGLALFNGSVALHTNTWYHVAMTYDGTVLKQYINGVQDGSLAVTGQILPTGNPLIIGGEASGPWDFAGMVDEVSLYNRALSASEIQSIFNAGSAGKCVPQVAPSIVTQPVGQATMVGGNATFTVGAAGTAPLAYQWYFNSSNLVSGATSNSLTISNAQMANAGNYLVMVSNAYGTATSSNALLTVAPLSSMVQVVSVTAGSGIVTVPVNLISQADENALGFSLNFPASILTFQGVALGSDASAKGGTLLVNSNAVGSGQLGLAIGLPTNTLFNAGTQQVALVSFFAGPSTNTQVANVTFGDSPTLRQVVSAQATILSATYSNGTVTIPFLGFEGDVSPVPGGDGAVTIADWVQEGRFVAGLDSITNGSLYQRADCAPRGTLGDGHLTVADWVQVGRYAVGLDPLTPAGGPATGNAVPPPSQITQQDLTPRTLTAVPPASAVVGQLCRVSIQLASQGNENALGFSLNYDPTVLTYWNATVGGGDPTATFLVNSSMAGAGNVGLALALPSGSAFTAGSVEVAQVTFMVSGTATNGTSLVFGNQPVFADTSDPAANDLPTTYINGNIGSVLLNAPPTLLLSLTSDSTGAVLTWPSTAAGYNLESSIDLTPGSWSAVNASLVTNSNSISATVTITNAQQFFRLHHP